MNRYLSYGGGVNSTALLLYLLDRREKFEAVYADHEADWPETRQYVKMLQEKGYQITMLRVRLSDVNFYDYCKKYRIIPLRFMRWCTHKFKVRPLHKYFKKPCIQYLGFGSDEEHRVKPSGSGGIESAFPLVEAGIDRNACIDIIKQHELPIPIKSGCFFCPFQRISQWKKLREEHPDLWCKVLQLEKVTNERIKEQGKKPLYLRDKPIERVIHDEQEDLFGWKPPCMCNL